MMKRTLKGVLENLRSTVGAQQKPETEIEETLRSDNFSVCKTVRHGFPYQPTALAYDPVQHLLAIGTKNGSLRIFGRPGVDVHIRHDGDVAVLQIMFLTNEGALITVCSNDVIHLWNLRQKNPEIVHSLKFQRERITYCHIPFQSKWLYIGTERGNVHIANVESFQLSGYVINWNKAIELSQRTHPGPIVHLSDNPVDAGKLLIGFETGVVVFWDLKSKAAEYRFNNPQALRSITWEQDGKQFMCSLSDGSLVTWNYKKPTEPVSIISPHAKISKDGRPDPCKPINKVEWKSSKNGEPYIIFSGGMSYDRAGKTPCLTVINGKSTTVLEMEHNVVDFISVCTSPWSNDFQDPYAIIVLLQNDLVVVDLTSPGYPCFENPYPMDLHESPVTCCQYYADCPPDLIPAFYSVGSKQQKKSGFSTKEWPVKGGEWGTTTCSYPEIIITGHADGSIKFWDASAVTLQVLYKVKTAKIFDKHHKNKCSENGSGGVGEAEEGPFAIQQLYLEAESRMLVVAGRTHVVLLKYSKQEGVLEVPSLEISIVYEVFDEVEETPEFEFPPIRPSIGLTSQKSGSVGSYSSSASDTAKQYQHQQQQNQTELFTSVKVKGGSRKFSAGYQPTLVCVLGSVEGEKPGNITSISVNSSYGLLAFGNDTGLAIVDYMQKTCLLNMGTPDLYGSMDPYQRVPRSPKTTKSRPNDLQGVQAQNSTTSEDCKSPTSEQPPPSPGLASSNLCSPRSPRSPGTPRNERTQTLLTVSATENLDLNHQDDVSGTESDGSMEIETALEAFEMEKREMIRELESIETGELQSKFLIPHPAAEERPTMVRRAISMPVSNKPLVPALDDDDEDDHVVNSLKMAGSNSRSQETVKYDLNCDETDDKSGMSQFRRFSIKVKKKFHSVKTTRPKCKSPSDNYLSVPTADGEQKRRGLIKRDSKGVAVLDLRSEEPGVSKKSIVVRNGTGDQGQSSSFSRSRSSSMSSLENVSQEGVRCLVFADSYTRKTDAFTCPCLWVGTSLGSVIVIVLNLPPPGEQRLNQPVIVSPSGTIFRLKGAILAMSFLDCNGILIPAVSEQWRDAGRDEKARSRPQTDRQISLSGNKPRMSPTASTEMCDRQFAIICSEKQARVMSLPSQTCAYKVKVTETSYVAKAEVVAMKDSVCLVCFIASGRLMVFSLPSLRVLMDMDFLSLTDLSQPYSDMAAYEEGLTLMARSFCISNNGHALYMCSPNEVQKVAFSAEITESLNEMLGDLFLPCETPEQPKQGFFKNLFSGGTQTLDREQLFGETSGKAAKGLAKHIPGGMASAQASAASATSEIGRAKMLAMERGEKLGELEMRTAAMMDKAKSYRDSAHALSQHYKDKKWYQF